MRPNRSIDRVRLAIVLVAGSFSCAGCLYVPVPSKPYYNERDPRTAVSSIFVRRHLSVSKSTRSDVVAELGGPTLCSANGRELGYQWVAVEAYLLIIGMPPLPERKCHVFVFAFDHEGVLRSTRMSNPKETYGKMNWVDGKPVNQLPPVR